MNKNMCLYEEYEDGIFEADINNYLNKGKIKESNSTKKKYELDYMEITNEEDDEILKDMHICGHNKTNNDLNKSIPRAIDLCPICQNLQKLIENGTIDPSQYSLIKVPMEDIRRYISYIKNLVDIERPNETKKKYIYLIQTYNEITHRAFVLIKYGEYMFNIANKKNFFEVIKNKEYRDMIAYGYINTGIDFDNDKLVVLQKVESATQETILNKINFFEKYYNDICCWKEMLGYQRIENFTDIIKTFRKESIELRRAMKRYEKLEI